LEVQEESRKFKDALETDPQAKQTLQEELKSANNTISEQTTIILHLEDEVQTLREGKDGLEESIKTTKESHEAEKIAANVEEPKVTSSLTCY